MAPRPSLLLAVVMAGGLLACSDLSSGPSTRPVALAPPAPAEGLWAILDPGCAKPSVSDPNAWPRCASPFWIEHNSAVVVRAQPASTRPAAQGRYRASYRFAAGDPLIAKVGNSKDGYLFLALTNLGRDERGRLIAAVGAAFACPKPDGAAVTASPNQGGCESAPEASVRLAAMQTLKDPTALSRVAWIAPAGPAAP